MKKEIILLKWDALTVSFVASIYGIQLIASPQILDGYKAYDVISYLFNSKTFGIAFILLGVIKFYSIYTNNIKLKSITISLLGGLWIFFFTGFVLSPVANSLWVLPLAMFLLCVGIALKEWSH